MSPVALLTSYCVVVVAASLLGGWVPLLLRLTHRRMELLLSFVSGAMLGVALLHLLPHAWMQHAAAGGAVGSAGHEQVAPVVRWLLAGLLVMFFVERIFCFHHHEEPRREGPARHGHDLTWTGAAIGLTVHSLIAGVALAASVEAEAGTGARVMGLSTFLAIVLHKPFDSMTLATLMAAGRWPAGSRHAVNAAFGLAVPAGAALFYLGTAGPQPGPSRLVAAALAFSAGAFLCIALSDLLPELQFHRHDRVKLSAALLLGIAVAWGAGLVEARAHEAAAAGSAGPESSLDPGEPMGMLIRPCPPRPAPSRSPLPGPAEGRPRSAHRA